MGKSTVVVGSQWGDEGKGKIVDVLGPEADAVVRFNGANNAGHTIVHEGVHYIGHFIPSGALNPQSLIVLAQGMGIEPRVVWEEIHSFPERLHIKDRLWISPLAHVITPMHIYDDNRHEKSGKGVGSTKNGVRPCYEDRAGRRGVRLGDVIFQPRQAMERLEAQIKHWNYPEQNASQVFFQLQEQVLRLQDNFTNVPELLHTLRATGRNILYEGAQGALLDVDYGTYPFVTSSHTTAGGVCIGAGVGPKTIDEIVAIVKCVQTRVGEGPFPSELVDSKTQTDEIMRFVYQQEKIYPQEFEALPTIRQNAIRKKWTGQYKMPEQYAFVIEHLAEAQKVVVGSQEVIPNVSYHLQQILGTEKQKTFNHILGMYLMAASGEFGATTGRPRRTGWLDLVALRYAAQTNGFTCLALTKLDCLSDLPSLKVATGHSVDGEVRSDFPVFNVDQAKPVYTEMEGWKKEEIQQARRWEDLPPTARRYASFVAEYVGVPVSIISVGPDRKQTMVLQNPWR